MCHVVVYSILVTIEIYLLIVVQYNTKILPMVVYDRRI